RAAPPDAPVAPARTRRTPSRADDVRPARARQPAPRGVRGRRWRRPCPRADRATGARRRPRPWRPTHARPPDPGARATSDRDGGERGRAAPPAWTLLQLRERLIHTRQHAGRILLVVEVLVLIARSMDRRFEGARRRQEVGARDVFTVGRVLLAQLAVLVLVETDHHELLRLLDHLRVVEHGAVVLAVRAPLGEEDHADRPVVLLRG